MAVYIYIYIYIYIYLSGITPRKYEQPLRGMELYEKEEVKDVKQIGKWIRYSSKFQSTQDVKLFKS